MAVASLFTGGAGGGAVFSEVAAAGLSAAAVVSTISAAAAGSSAAAQGYRPPVWQRKPLTFITVPAAATTPSYDSSGVLRVTTQASTMYVFDGVSRVAHQESTTITHHPIQTGANIADHAYSNAARVTLDVSMSDAMAAYQQGMWSGSPSKSVSAWLTLKKLKDARVPLTITTRLNTYSNMLIIGMDSDDVVQTRWGLRAPVTFEQIFTAQIATLEVSARPQTTDSTGNGTVQGATPSAALSAEHQVTTQTTTVPNAGAWSSNSFSTLADYLTQGGPS